MNRKSPAFPPARLALTLLAALLLALALHTHGPWLYARYYPYALLLAGAGALSIALWFLRGRPATTDLARALPLLPLLAGMLLVLFSSTMQHKWFYFLNWTPHPTLLAGNRGLAIFAALTLLLTPFLARGPRRPWLPVLAILLLSEIACIAALWLKTGGAPLYRTDHPSFMLRLWEFSRQFPQLVNYLPLWNGGIPHEASVLTGVAGPGLTLWPLFRFFPVHTVYTAAWAILYLVFVPWIAVASVRALGGDRTAAFAGGILGLGVSQHFFLWALHYGTIGAGFASAMTMPVCALGFRTIWLGRLGFRTALALIIAGTLLLMWPLCGTVALAVALTTLCSASRWSWRKVLFLAACAAAILLLFSPWLLAILSEGQTELSFVSRSPHPASSTDATSPVTLTQLRSGASHLAAHLMEVNPVILFLGLLGAALGPSRALRRWYLPILLVLALVTGWAREWLPKSQLSRMSIPLAFAAVPPAALFIGRLLRTRDIRLAAVRAGIVVLLILTGWNVRAICSNRSPAHFTTMPGEIDQLVSWIRANTPPDGRLLFAGLCVHGYGGGNVAYLPVLTGRHMLAADYYGTPPELTPKDYPPPEFLQTPEALEFFLDAYNVSHLLTYHNRWKLYLRFAPDKFTEVANFGNITVFARRSHPGLFREGSGTVTADVNRITVSLSDANAPAVVAYNWVDGLRVAPPVEITPHPVTNGITLIGITPHGQSSFTIGFHPNLLHHILAPADTPAAP